MKQTLTDLILNAWKRAAQAGQLPDVELPPWRLELPKNPQHGDYASNIAMVCASVARTAPRKVAETLLAHLEDPEEVLDGAEIAGPGFINFRFKPKQWHRVLHDIGEAADRYGKTDVGAGRKVQVEFVSANPTGPLHVGHGRGAVVGDVTARILEAAGFDVDREYYVNDAGNQIATLGGSVYYRYMELLDRPVGAFPETFYQGDYITEIARDVIEVKGEAYAGMARDAAIKTLGALAGERILGEIRDDLAAFGVVFQKWYSEKSLYDRGEVARALEALEQKGVAYRSDDALWLRTSDYGDEKDRVLVRADGRETYFASDIAYHLEKFERGYQEVIDVWGADHHGYVPRVRAALEAFGRDSAALDVLMVQFVNLLRDGVQVSMSTRAGEFVKLSEVVDEVGADAARFLFLTRSCDTTLDFDLEVAKRQTSDNPVFYVQYVHARVCSVYREAAATGMEVPPLAVADLDPLELDEEIELTKLLYLFPEVVEGAALQREPHRLAYYLQDLAARFHQYYNKYRFLGVEPGLSVARLSLAEAVRQVVHNGLALMGVQAPEKM